MVDEAFEMGAAIIVTNNRGSSKRVHTHHLLYPIVVLSAKPASTGAIRVKAIIQHTHQRTFIIIAKIRTARESTIH